MSFAAVLQKLKTLENPYPGLRPFEGEESHLFFGRDQQTAELVGRLERSHFVAVVGVSGSGKSSLVRAGLIPALERAQLSDAGRHWRMVVTRPGGAPYERLAADLAKRGLDGAALKNSSHGLIEVARQLPADESLLVIVDQFEELFRYKELGPAGDDGRQRHDLLAADAAEFVQLLLEAAKHQPPVYVVLTMRSDYLGDCAEFRDLPETLNDCQYLVPRLTREQRKEAILGPLGRVEMEPALVQRLLNVTGDEPDQLPVLQHALMRTWNHWHRKDREHTRRIELKDYDAIGGLSDALNLHAEELVTGTPPDITATIFKRLTARGRSSRERRNPATLAELWAVCLAEAPDRQQQVTAVVDRFRQGEATFLVPRGGALDADTYVDITHESLIRQWKALRDRWLPEEQASAKVFLDLIDGARNWKNRAGPLLIGLNLRDAVDWETQRNPAPAWARYYASESALAIVLEFIRASEKQERDERLWRRRVRYSLIGAVAVGVVGLVLAAVGQYQSRVSAQRTADVARAATYEAQILSVPSVPDPLTRALLLAELGPHAKPEHLVIYQQAAAVPIPTAVFRYSGPERGIGGGFLADGRTAVARADGALWSWSSDGRGDPSTRALAAGASHASGSNAGATPRFNLAAFSHDGRWIAAGSADGVVSLGRTAGAEKLRQLLVPDPAEPKEVYALAFSRDGRQLAVGYSNYKAEVVRIDASSGSTTANPTRLTGGHFAPITSIDFNPDGTRLVSGALDGTLRVWNLREPAKPPLALAGSDRTHDAVNCVAFSPDGVWIVSGYDSGAVRIVRSDGTAAAEGPRLSGHTAPITAASFSPARDSYKVVTASADNTARIWTLQERMASGNGGRSILSPVGTASVLTHDAPVTAVAFSTDGSRIVTTSDDGAARLWPSEQGEPRTVGLHRGRVESVTFNPDATRVLSASDDKTAQLWSAAGAGVIQKFGDHADWVRKAAFSPTDLLKVVTADDSGTLRMWEMKGPGPPRARLTQEGGTVFDAAFNRQGDRLVTAVGDKTARIWKTSALIDGASALDPHEATAPIEFHHDASVLGAAFSPDGSQIVTASQDGTVRIWLAERDQRAPVRTIPGREVMAFKAAFSPDGTRLVTAYADGVARVWRTGASPGEPLLELRHRQDVNEAVFSPLGHWIATASKDGTAKLWDALDGTERVALQHGKEVVRAVAFDSTETRVVTGTGDGVVRVWRITVKGLRDYLEGATTACLPPSAHVRFLGESSAEAWNQYRACERRWGRTPLAEPGGNTLTTGSNTSR